MLYTRNLLKKNESVKVEWNDGGVLMSKGFFSELFDKELTDEFSKG